MKTEEKEEEKDSYMMLEEERSGEFKWYYQLHNSSVERDTVDRSQRFCLYMKLPSNK